MTDAIRTTIGVDLGDRCSSFCALDQVTGEELERGQVPTEAKALGELFTRHGRSRVVVEVGTHSRWVAETAETMGAEALVANARRLRFIFKNDRKSDEVDAWQLARIGRLDPSLLSPIQHRSMACQRDLALIRARATLVQARTKLVNCARGICKSFNERLPTCATSTLGRLHLAGLPEGLKAALQPLLGAIELLTQEISQADGSIERLAATSYPETRALTQVFGVGDLTALAFVLTLEDHKRFASSRDVGAFLGLVPRRDQSGGTDKQLSITKAGDRLVRTLLVQCAQRILSPKAQDSDLRQAGLRIAARGGKRGKRRAVIAVARKLAVLLHALWRTGEVYEPLRSATTVQA